MTSVGTGLEGVGILFEWSAFEVLLYYHNIYYELIKDEIVQTLWFSTVKYTTFLGPNIKVFFSYSSFKRTLVQRWFKALKQKFILEYIWKLNKG